MTNDFAIDLIKLAQRHSVKDFAINNQKIAEGSASIERIAQIYNQKFMDYRFAKVSTVSMSMRNSFNSVKYLMPDLDQWITYLSFMSSYKFEGITGKIGLPFFLSDKVVTNYLNGQYESKDRSNLDKLYEEYYQQRGVNAE